MYIDTDIVNTEKAIKDNDKGIDADWNDDNNTCNDDKVEVIRGHRKSIKRKYSKYDEDGGRYYEYLVKWKGWRQDSNTWEHETELKEYKDIIDKYWMDHLPLQLQKIKQEHEAKGSCWYNNFDKFMMARVRK